MDLVEQFEKYVATLIDATGIYPAPMLVKVDPDGLEMCALALNPSDATMHFCTATARSEVSSAIIGLDRFTKPGQGTEFNDVLTCILYTRAARRATFRLREQFRYGLIHYQHEPRIVRPIEWDHPYWTPILQRELHQYIPPLVIENKA